MNNKEKIATYKKAYKKCEEGLKEKGEATSAQILSWLIEKYSIRNLNISTRSIAYHFKREGYKKYRPYETRPYIYLAEKEDNDQE